jgi:glycosyltransferase involved in cell wall biosynthesis
MKLSVVVTTYNRPDALQAVLQGYAAQSDLAFELIVADDGSTSDTASLVDQFAAQAQFPVSHVWQDDAGFRAAPAVPTRPRPASRSSRQRTDRRVRRPTT